MMEFSQPKTLRALYRITTPMFLGGDDQQVDARQFRNASFKGALRFWWRALNWGRMLKGANGNTKQALLDLHDREGELFGLASDGRNSRQSLVQIRSELGDVKQAARVEDLSGLAYLLGQGLYHFKNGVLRDSIPAGKELGITLQFKPAASVEDCNSVRQAMIALGLFGALGSRARKGFGSLSLQSISNLAGEEERFDKRMAVEEFVASLDFSAGAGAPLSAFAQDTKIDISVVESTGLKALKVISDEMQLYRSFGRNGKVNGKEARRNFVADHDDVQAATRGERLQRLPQRAVFGLPHNYFFSSSGAKLEINAEEEGRRAAPLFIHVHALDDGRYLALQTLLPAQFLPQGKTIDVKGDRRTQKLHDHAVDFSVITRYLDGFPDRETLRSPTRG